MTQVEVRAVWEATGSAAGRSTSYRKRRFIKFLLYALTMSYSDCLGCLQRRGVVSGEGGSEEGEWLLTVAG